MAKTKEFISDLSKKKFPKWEKIRCSSLDPHLYKALKRNYVQLSIRDHIAISDLESFRLSCDVNSAIDMSIGNVAEDFESDILPPDEVIPADTFGQRVADQVAEFGGSWTFIISFMTMLVFWILLNVLWFSDKGFDPYPFILLNLILSCLAALQAPVIMMSQNRQEEKDRLRAQNDYQINIKSEYEIRMLSEKIDEMLMQQHEEVLKIQKLQTDKIDSIIACVKKPDLEV